MDIQPLIDLALDKFTLLTAGGIFFFLRFVAKTRAAKHPLYRRFLPILPDLLGVAAALSGALPALGELHPLFRVAGGLWCGYIAQRFHKVLGQTILGDDAGVSTVAVRRAMSIPPPMDPNAPPRQEVLVQDLPHDPSEKGDER